LRGGFGGGYGLGTAHDGILLHVFENRQQVLLFGTGRFCIVMSNSSGYILYPINSVLGPAKFKR
jgi:hypothetical protein